MGSCSFPSVGRWSAGIRSPYSKRNRGEWGKREEASQTEGERGQRTRPRPTSWAAPALLLQHLYITRADLCMIECMFTQRVSVSSARSKQRARVAQDT